MAMIDRVMLIIEQQTHQLENCRRGLPGLGAVVWDRFPEGQQN